MLRRSRSAAAPDLPTAMTTRPQFGSSPAIAVLTSGELAIESPTLRASAALCAPVTRISTNLVAPSPSRTTWCARSRITSSSAAAKVAIRGSPASVTGAMGARPVAATSSVSDVEVSPSTVMQLNVASAARETAA